jgi:hypothetical protein
MSTLSRNYRGAGQPCTVQELTRLVCQYYSKIVFISETRQHRDRVSNLRYRFGLKMIL